VTVETVVGTTDHHDAASKDSQLVLADRVALVRVAKVHEVVKLVHGGRHYTAVAFLEKGSLITSASKGYPDGSAISPKHGPVGHAEHDKVVMWIRRIEAPSSNAQLSFRCSYNLVLAITKDVARRAFDGSLSVHDSALHSMTESGELDIPCAK
jgi:hypothetical protein